MDVKIKKIDHSLFGKLSFPGDKSLSHRAIIFGSLAKGESHFTNVLAGEDCVCTRKAFEKLGVWIRASSPTDLTIKGRGLYALKAPREAIDLGNSGTAIRLLMGILAGNPFEATLTGDSSLCSRPMRRVTDYLKQMGATLEGRDSANFAPIKIKGGKLRGIEVKLPISSAQVKSAILLAGLYAEGRTSVTEPVGSRDHTERFLKYFCGSIEKKGLTVSIEGGQKLKAKSFKIAGDISSAAFFMAMAMLVKGSDISFKEVLWNPTRLGTVEVMKRMGAHFDELKLSDTEGPEVVSDFSIQPQPLNAFEIEREELPSLIDEVPILTVLATQAKGKSIIHDADELRVKETDRIHSMVSQLSKIGARIEAKGNTIVVEGPTALHGAKVNSFKDHRTAMSLVVAGMLADGETTVRDIECINTSFPNFFELLKKMKVGYELC